MTESDPPGASSRSIELTEVPDSTVNEQNEAAATAPVLESAPEKSADEDSLASRWSQNMWTCLPEEYRGEAMNWFGATPALMFRGVLSGLIVSMLQVPESIAFALVAKVPVASGLWVRARAAHPCRHPPL